MARKDRTGERKPRQQRSNRRVPDLGYYLIVTDTEGTERCYFNGFHENLPSEMCPCTTVYDLVSEIRGKTKF